jgi:hypothetical protein
MKRVSVLLFAVFCALNLYAQERPIFGLKAGLNLAKTTNDNGLSRDLKAGLHAGVLAHIHLTRQFALQPELVYSGQGAKYTVLGDEHNLNLNYVNIPVMLQFMFDNGFRLQTGPQLGFLFDVNDKFNGNETGFFTSDDFKTIAAMCGNVVIWNRLHTQIYPAQCLCGILRRSRFADAFAT